ncbi:unnamed protein product [Absidia cylindrospora]
MMRAMNKSTFYLSILIAFLWIIVACRAAEPTDSSSSAPAPSASASQKCPPIACTQPSGKPKCPSECSDACHFEADRCCPNKQVGVCSSSASASASASGGPASGSSSAAATSGAATASASTGGASSAASGSGSASSASPSTSAGVALIRNTSHYYVLGILCISALYLI